MTDPALTPDLIAAHGLSSEEYDSILDIIGREPSFTELGIFSACGTTRICSYREVRRAKKMAAHRLAPGSARRSVRGRRKCRRLMRYWRRAAP